MSDAGEEEQDYREEEINGEQYGDEEQYADDMEGDEEQFGEDAPERDSVLPAERVKELILTMQIEIKRKEAENLMLRQQNNELIEGLEKVLQERTNEAEQLKKVKAYEANLRSLQEAMTEKLKADQDQSANGISAELISSSKQTQKENEDLRSALTDSNELNKKMKQLLTDKDGLINKMQGEMEKMLTVRKEIDVYMKGHSELREQLEEKTRQVEELQAAMEDASKLIGNLPAIETHVKNISASMKELAAENVSLQERAITAEGLQDSLNQEVEGMRADLMKFVNNDGETKKLLDMFEKALETLAAENKVLKTKLAESMQEVETTKVAKEKAEEAFVRVKEEASTLISAVQAQAQYQKAANAANVNLTATQQQVTPITVQEPSQTGPRQTWGSSTAIGKAQQKAAGGIRSIGSVKQSEPEIREPTNIEKRLKQALAYASEYQPEEEQDDDDDTIEAGHVDYESVKLQPAEQREFHKFGKLKENNLQLSRENESLRARAKALEKEAIFKSQNYDVTTIGKNIAAEILTSLRSVHPYGSSDDDGPSLDPLLLRSSIKLAKPKKKAKAVLASSLASGKYRSVKKETRSKQRNDEIDLPRNTHQDERQAQLETFLCTQIERLNSDLNKEREWRDAILNAGHSQLVQGSNLQTRQSATSIRSPPTSVRNMIAGFGTSSASASPQFLSQLEALARAADPEILNLKSQQEQAELGRVETTMHRAFDDFERKIKSLKSKLDATHL